MMDLAHLGDLVLKRLLNIGCFDWKTPNSVSGPGNGITYLLGSKNPNTIPDPTSSDVLILM